MNSENKQLKILWLLPKWTFPINDGAKVASDALIRNISKFNVLLDIACISPSKASDEVNLNFRKMFQNWDVNNIFYNERACPKSKIQKFYFYLKNIILKPTIPLTMCSFCSESNFSFIKKLVNEQRYDYIFLDGLHLGAIFHRYGKIMRPSSSSKLIYRAHNIESEIWEKAARNTSNILLKIALKYQAILVKSIEKKIIDASDLILPISKEDEQKILEKFNSKKTHLTLLGFAFNTTINHIKTEKNNFLFIGNLNWPPNRDGLLWLLNSVWPFINLESANLHIVGDAEDKLKQRIQKYPGVTYHGCIRNVDDVYKFCQASLVPIFYGSGTRIKVIESVSKNRIVISTKMGAQGSQLSAHEDYICAETSTKWIDTINNFSEKENLAMLSKSREKIREDFDEKIVAEKLYKRLLYNRFIL